MAQSKSRIGSSESSTLAASPFLGGLNTELAGVIDSTDYTKDELNMVVRADGSRSRRLGVDYEELFKFNRDAIPVSVQDLAFNAIEWYDVNSPDESVTYRQIPYIVVQIGSKIIFYKNYGRPFSQAEEAYQIDLMEENAGVPVYALDSDPTDPNYRDPAKFRCKFTIAYGCLFITSEAIKPIRLRGAMEEEAIPGSYPDCVVACTAYQGKHQRMGSCPGPVWEVYFADEGIGIPSRIPNIAFYEIYLDNVLVLHNDVPLVGSYTPFPNSYTIAQAFNALDSTTRRSIVATAKEPDASSLDPASGGSTWSPADWITFQASSDDEAGVEIRIKVSGCYYRSGGWFGIQAEYPGVLASKAYVTTGGSVIDLKIRDTYIGAQDYLDIQEYPEKLSYAHLYNLLNQGWTTDLIAAFYTGYTDSVGNHHFPGNNLAQQYLKDSTTEAFKPDKLINTTFGNTPAARGHVKLNFFVQDRNNVTNLTNSMQAVATALNKSVADILDTDFPGADEDPTIATDPTKQVPIIKPRRDFVVDTIAYAGRIFYLTGSTLLYSQVISEDVRRSSQCYTDADPTSEELSDVIETDGGLIELPDIGEGVKLAQVGSYLIVFGTRGNVAITGTANNIFTATAYSAGAMNCVPTQAPDSFINTEYGLFYWGTTGINFLGLGEGGLTVQDLSTEKILTWFGKLTNTQHKWCKGVYSSSKKRLYWFYPSNDEKPRRLDKILVYDIQRQAFLPQQVATGYTDENGEYVETNTPEIVSGLSLKVPFKETREYPVLSSIANTVEDGDWYRTLEPLSIADDNCIVFRLDNSCMDSLEVGDSVDIAKFGDKVIVSATMTSDSMLSLNLMGSTYSASRSAKTWFGFTLADPDTYQIIFLRQDSLTPDSYKDSIQSLSLITWLNLGTRTATGDPSEEYFRVNKELFSGSINNSFGAGPYSIANQEFSGWSFIASTDPVALEILDDDGIKILADDPIDSEEFTYESSILVCLDVANAKITFGDFRNNRMKDWAAGDASGDGYIFDSYLISHPMNATSSTNTLQGSRRVTDLIHTKDCPYLITYFRRTETGTLTDGEYLYPSKCQGSLLWDWRTSGAQGKWSSPTDLYRPYKRTMFESGYTINKTNIRGLGRAYQLKLESVDDAQLILEGLVFSLKNDGRI